MPVDNPIRDFLHDPSNGLFVPGHIEVRRDDGVPAQHTTGWLNKELLAINSSWLRFLADAMAKKVSERIREPLQTIVLTHDNYQACTFGAMVGAKLASDRNFTSIQAATMKLSYDPPRHNITMNAAGYKAAQRIIIADVASFTLDTLRHLTQAVRHDRGKAQPEIIIVCAMRLFYEEIQAPTETVLKNLPVLIGHEIATKQFRRIQRCELCQSGRPLTHVFDPADGFRNYNAKDEEQKAADRAALIEQLKQRDDKWQAAPIGQRGAPPNGPLNG